MKQLVQVLGPTGVGKSSVAVELALRFSGEIISADSMQVYQGFDIGTDKISLEKMRGVPHYLLDIIPDCTQFNAADFLEQSFRLAEDMRMRNRVPVVCGGTALYLRTMIRGIFPELPRSNVSRQILNRLADQQGIELLYERLRSIDPEYGKRINVNDRIRIIRALEIYYNNFKPPSEVFKLTKTPFADYRIIRIGLQLPREILYQRIEQRVDAMLEKGFVEEVRALRKKRSPGCPPFKSLGYSEILMYLDKKTDLAGAVSLMKQHSRNFAKRQLSWFRQEKDILWFSPKNIAGICSELRNRLAMPND